MKDEIEIYDYKVVYNIRQGVNFCSSIIVHFPTETQPGLEICTGTKGEGELAGFAPGLAVFTGLLSVNQSRHLARLLSDKILHKETPKKDFRELYVERQEACRSTLEFFKERTDNFGIASILDILNRSNLALESKNEQDLVDMYTEMKDWT